MEERVQVADDDTLESARAVGLALERLGFGVSLLEVPPGSVGMVGKIKSDLVFNLCEWSGKDFMLGVGVIRVLEEKGITFTGTDAEGYSWDSQKQIMKRKFDRMGIPTPKWFVVEKEVFDIPYRFPLPAIIKPALEHCAIGVSQDSVVFDRIKLKKKVSEMWKRFGEPILVEEFASGKEYQVTVLEKDGRPWVLPASEIVYRSAQGFMPILTFDSKWDERSAEVEMSQIRILRDKKQRSLITDMCARAFSLLKCRDYVRFDLREKEGEMLVLEVNVNPGLDFDPEYGLTVSAKAVGMDFQGVVAVIAASALRRARLKKHRQKPLLFFTDFRGML